VARRVGRRVGQVAAGVAALSAVLLVRHAVALRHAEWVGDDMARPLSVRGLAQAAALVEQLAEFPIRRVLASPATRCVQTVAPLATSRGLTVEISAALAEGAGGRAVEFVSALGIDGGVVLCSHGDVIPDVLDSLGGGGHAIDAPRCKKGSTWVIIERADGTRRGDRYLPPPA